MGVKGFLFGALVCATGNYVLRDLGHQTIARFSAFNRAKELEGGKGIINIGAGPHRTYQAQLIAEDPGVLSNIDIALDGMPHFMRLDVERNPLPFADKQFGVSFASHVLEHLDNWQFTLREMVRVADYVVIVLPHPIYFSGWLIPAHRQHFSIDDIDGICELYPNVEIYY